MFDGRWRTGVDRVARPFGVFLVKAGATADLMTFSGMCCALATAIAVGSGHFPLGVVLLTLTGFHDALDGAVAKVAGTSSVRGAFFDSVADRLTDAILLGGVAYWLSVHRSGSIELLPFAILTVSFLVSYERAKAESLGFYAKGGLMERAERTILLGVALLGPSILVPTLWVMLVLTSCTAFGRFLRVWRQASGRDEDTRFAMRMAQAKTYWRDAQHGTWRPKSRDAELTAKALGGRRSRRSVQETHTRRDSPQNP
jgi:CDP-diacylglycerol--glycerol-3-phosphate 3-phosphatidyltransferase